MTDLSLDIAADLRELAEPRPRGEKIEHVITRVARAAGFEYWRTYDLWYRKARRVEADERRAVSKALELKRKEAARNELHDLRTRLLRLESLLAQSDPDFDRPRHALARDDRR